MNGVAVDQVDGTKLLGITLDCKLSWSKHIDSMVVYMGRESSICNKEMGRVLSVIMRWGEFYL